jgi:hypothetical protein
MFRFHLWEPIWYYEPRTKQPENSLKKAQWLGIAHSAGDAMIYFIETEQDGTSKRNVIWFGPLFVLAAKILVQQQNL